MIGEHSFEAIAIVLMPNSKSNKNYSLDGFKLNEEGTTIMLVTHDSKVAAKCTRVLFIVDGNIKGEYDVDVTSSLRDRERALDNWLMDMGW